MAVELAHHLCEDGKIAIIDQMLQPKLCCDLWDSLNNND